MDTLTSFRLPTEGIRHQEPNTTIYMNSNDLGKGMLYISESQVAWEGPVGSGFSLDYKQISLHAVSRDLNSYPQECLLLILDLAEESEENGYDSVEEVTEVRIVPEDKGVLDAMFHAMSACQALHPDPQDSFSDDELYDAAEDVINEEEMEGADSQMSNLYIGQNGQNSASDDVDPACFEDAEDSPDN